MTGLNKDKDKDKRSGETRVSNFFNIYIHVKNQYKQHHIKVQTETG